MSTIKPIDGYLVNPERVEQIASPAYDALTPQQRYEFAVAHPRNYLNVMRSREEFPEGERPSLDELLAGNRARLKRMLENADFIYQSTPGFYIYRLKDGGHVQTGLVAEIPIDEYEQGLVKKHEHTQQDKEDDLTAYQQEVRASSSPVCLAYPARNAIDRRIGELTKRAPVTDFGDGQGLTQSIWRISDQDEMSGLERLFDQVPASYLTDGHHRAASATRFRAAERSANPNHTGDEAYNFLLVAFFPNTQLQILPYNRCVKGRKHHSLTALLSAIETSFEVEPLEVTDAETARPRKRGEIAMCIDEAWYRLTARPGVAVPNDPVQALDVSILQQQVLGPVLGIDDPRSDPRMDYLSGAFDLNQLQAHCREHDEIGFAVFPTAIEDLMAVADASAVMPPKSTWFDPKLRSGLFLRMR